jgi:hypothetical protein
VQNTGRSDDAGWLSGLAQPSLGRQPKARWYFPPEVDYRLSMLHPDAKGLVVWVIEAKVSERYVSSLLVNTPWTSKLMQ